jgi:hypothetical protein
MNKALRQRLNGEGCPGAFWDKHSIIVVLDFVDRASTGRRLVYQA